MARESLYDVITQAVSDLSEHGFDSAERVAFWQAKIKAAAEASLTSADELERMLRQSMASIYKRLVESGGAIKHHPGVSRFTLDKLRPQMRAELDRRILASGDLIKLNRGQAIDKTLSRFSGWATSIPAGGSKAVDKVEEKAHIRKALTSSDWDSRRVLIDQGHKLSASIHQTLANDGQALGGYWNSHYRQPGYNFRKDHAERAGKFYLFRGTWAQKAGLIKPGPDGYYDEITAVASEPFCRCWLTFSYALRQLPPECLTAKGVEELERARKVVAAA